jgi:hypothetical protein
MRANRTASTARRRRQSGNTIVEFAVTSALMVGMFTGMFQYGYAFWAYNALVNAVRNGARYGSNSPYSSLNTTPDADYSDRVKKMVVYGTPVPADGAQPVVKGLSTNNVSIVVTGAGTGSLTPPAKITVKIVNFNLDAVFGTIQLNGKPTATFLYTGVLTPLTS